MQSQIGALKSLESAQSVDQSAYLNAILALADTYDSYLFALESVDLARAALINVQATSDVLNDKPAIDASDKLPLTFDDLKERGITPTSAELKALARTGGASGAAARDSTDVLNFTSGVLQGARNTIIVGGLCIGAAVLLGPAAIGPGMVLLARSVQNDVELRQTNDNLKGGTLALSVLGDVSGFTSISVGIHAKWPLHRPKVRQRGTGEGSRSGTHGTGVDRCGGVGHPALRKHDA